MIFNTLENLEKYCSLDKKYVETIKNFISACSADIADGTYLLDGEEVYANVSSYATSPGKTDEFEYHQKYTDLQVLLSGEEYIYLSDISRLEPFTQYDDGKDFGLRKGKEQTFINLIPGTFALFFPWDAHQVCRSAKETVTQNKKIVFKILTRLFY